MQVATVNWLEHIANDLAEQGFAIEDNFLSPGEVDEILHVFDIHRENDRFKKAGIGKSDDFLVDKSIRGDYITWVDPKNAYPPVQRFLQKVEELKEYLNQTCFLGIQDYETHFTIYPEGSFYARHLDQFKNTGNRKISFICYLNQVWDHDNGGHLRLYLEDGPTDILPIAGRLACFVSSEIEHEVMVCNKSRYSLTGWMLNQKKELDFLINHA
ncbi:2OG-Fe(II) oxygenase [Fulvivirga sp. RKSG066]|uniref:2OG-Fe(II) oxygenase n=1 Tax=Fulvivirga aurantia TaxID=2529383 RepID=UPI0012BD23F3|nr:2OG-Fe(II) oxygenase [Fulvivirga aurantia]MTI21342.1 2OG-Fe(II) oxygenase [Fulvivirga aurantia]